MIKLLILLMISAQVYASDLTLYFIPSPKGMDWSSPSNLAKSALKNKLSFEPHFMGHVWVELKCGSSHEVTGMVGKNFDYLNQLFIEQRGLAILYHSFDGRLEDKDDILEEMKGYEEKGGMNFAKFILNDEQCKRASLYLSEYRKNNVGRYYGLSNRPRHGEGAGCTAFGVSFLDVTGVLDENMRVSWSKSVNIPLELSGRPLREENVSLFKVMFNADRWASEREPHKKLMFWDPDSMYQWVNEKVKAPGQLKVETKGKVSGIVIDKSLLPAPQEPIWEQVVDPKTKTTVQN